MAYNRRNFKKKIKNHLMKAIIYFYMARLSKKNGRIKLAEHWMNEVKQSNYSLLADIFRSIRTPKDQRKAFDEVATYFKKYNVSCQNCAEYMLKNNYGLTKIECHLNRRDETKFWNIIEETTYGVFSILEP